MKSTVAVVVTLTEKIIVTVIYTYITLHMFLFINVISIDLYAFYALNRGNEVENLTLKSRFNKNFE